MGVLKGSDEKYISPLGKQFDPIVLLVLWDRVIEANKHKLNSPLIEIEKEQRSKFGPRSMATTWAERKGGLVKSFHSQRSNFEPPFFSMQDGKGNLTPISIAEAKDKIRKETSSGLPKLTNKGSDLEDMLENFDSRMARKDPCVLYTRTAESKKTRNVWGYPHADIFYEMLFFVPFLDHMRTKFWQASIISPELVDIRITDIILKAIQCDKLLYSVDFKEFDASVAKQLIIKAFDYVKSCFAPQFAKQIDNICERFYTIEIITPTGILRGEHGVPSGSCFTNLVDSIVQAGVALSNSFINECEMMINGDDGVYALHEENIPQFENTWKEAGLQLGKLKVNIAPNWCTYCQLFYHIDYIEEGLIGGIYPTYRALNRLIWLEKFVDLGSKKKGKQRISSRDHFGIRTLSILEQCKYHPLFEELVRFVLEREKFALSVSQEGLLAYAQKQAKGRELVGDELNISDRTHNKGIEKYESYKLVQKIIAEEGYFDIVDLEALDPNEDEIID